MKAMAGFKGPVHFNPRAGVEVPDCLVDAVFPWLKESMRELDAFEKSHDDKLMKTTAWQFLKQMELLGPVVIQDVGAMKLLHPKQFENCPFINDPFF